MSDIKIAYPYTRIKHSRVDTYCTKNLKNTKHTIRQFFIPLVGSNLCASGERRQVWERAGDLDPQVAAGIVMVNRRGQSEQDSLCEVSATLGLLTCMALQLKKHLEE